MYNYTRPAVAEVTERVGARRFRPVQDGKTVEPTSGEDGLDDFENTDWRARTLALRDLVRAGDVEEVGGALEHPSADVRYLAAAALGILEADSSLDLLHRALREDPESTVRSRSAISLGQIGSEASLAELERQADVDGQRDVPPQCRIAIDAIRRYEGDQSELRAAYELLDESTFRTVAVGDRFPATELPTVDGERYSVADHTGKRVLLLWVFADWCPVCHHEFLDLIDRRERFAELDVEVATVECHDRYRCRVMAGREPKPNYWYSAKFPDLSYGERRWWPHLADFAGSLGARIGVDPMTFAVHSEFVNRPSTVVVGTDGTIRMAYHGTFWGDRPSIDEVLTMLEEDSYRFEHPKRR